MSGPFNGELKDFKNLLQQQDDRLLTMEQLLQRLCESTDRIGDQLSKLATVADKIEAVKTDLIPLLQGKDQVPQKTMDYVVTSYQSFIKIVCVVFILIFLWITGLKQLFPHLISTL